MKSPLTILGAIGLAFLSGCTVKSAEAPPLSGPSTLATSITVTALPDSILQDNSTSTIVATVTGPDGRPIANVPLRAEIFVNDIAQDFGTITPKLLTTGADGIARFTYTSPPRPVESVGTGTRVTIAVTPVGQDFGGEVRRFVALNVIPPGVILPPNGAPVASFVVTPTPANARQVLNFDASASTDEGVPCSGRCTYTWTFGDNTSGAGMVTTHEYRATGSFTVALTVTDQRGTAASTTQTLVVGATAAPTALFTMSPPSPVGISQDVFFNAETSTAVTGRRIVNYGWNFGDGRTATGVTVARSFSTPGTRQITLTVTDDSDAVGQNVQPLVVGGAGTGPVASATFLPAAPRIGQTVVFNGSGSTTNGATITSYRFNYGDGGSDEGSAAIQSHVYTLAGNFVLTLTVTDSLGRTASTTVAVPVIP